MLLFNIRVTVVEVNGIWFLCASFKRCDCLWSRG